MFKLPKFKGIEEAIADVRAHGAKTGNEMLIGLKANGKRLFEAQGNDHMVNVPHEFLGKGDGNTLLVHCHPGMTTELSEPDLSCITGMNAWGNVAACCDDETISWSRGFDVPRNRFVFEFHLMPEVREVCNWVVSQIARGEGICNDAGYQQWVHAWKDNDDRYVVEAHWVNRIMLKRHLLKDYHVQVGERAKAILEKYDDRFTEV